MNKKIFTLLLIFGLMGGSYTGLMAQLPEQMGFRKVDTPAYHLRAFTFASETEDRTLIKIGMKIANDDLQFTQMETGFEAAFEYTLMILDRRGNQVDGRIEKQTVEAFTYTETNSAVDFNLVESEFELPQGDYELVANVTDLDTKMSNQKRADIRIGNYSKNELEMSSILFVDEFNSENDRIEGIVPNVLNNFDSGQDSLVVWFEVYNTLYFDSLDITYVVRNHKKKQVRKNIFTRAVDQGRTPVSFALVRGDLSSGKYQLEIVVRSNKFKTKKAVDFSVNWLHLMPVASDLNNAVNQLKYIATSSELKKMKKAKGEEEKQVLFEEFWQNRDPSPGTMKNELFEEYYRRVRYTNITFGKYNEGWKTDMGMVFIRLGPPDEVERHPYDPESKPYQIWFYHRPPYELIFVDHSGFGEYRLTTASIDAINRLVR